MLGGMLEISNKSYQIYGKAFKHLRKQGPHFFKEKYYSTEKKNSFWLCVNVIVTSTWTVLLEFFFQILFKRHCVE